MDLEKLKPWNWFKHEVHSGAQIPVAKGDVKVDIQPTTAAPALRHSTHPLMQLHQEMDRLFDDVWRSFGLTPQSRLFQRPSLFNEDLVTNALLGDYRANLDISGNNKEYEVSIDLPGLSQEDIQINVTGHVLTINGQKEETSENKEKQYYRMERSYGSFQRTLSLPEDANTDNIVATMKNGVLQIKVPRIATPESEIKRIPISS